MRMLRLFMPFEKAIWATSPVRETMVPTPNFLCSTRSPREKSWISFLTCAQSQKVFFFWFTSCPISLECGFSRCTQKIRHEEFSWLMHFCIFFWYFRDKAARDIARIRPKTIPFVCACDDEFLLCSCHGNIPETTLFFELFWFKECP